MSGLSPSQSAYEATLVQQAATLAGSIQAAGPQVPAIAPPGASMVQQAAIGLQAQVAGTLSASLGSGGGPPNPGFAFSLPGTPPPTPLSTSGTNSYQSGFNAAALNNTETLLGSLGLGTNANSLA